MRASTRYRESGLEGVGEIPEHWIVCRADSVFEERRTSIGPEALAGQDVFHYSIPAIQETGDGRVEDGASIESNKLLLRGGELLVSKLNPRKGNVLIAEKKGPVTVCSSEFVALVPKSIDLRFGYYLYASEITRERLSAVVQSATRSHQRANPDEIKKFWFAVPPQNEQRAIAAYLDRKTTAIDALIGKKERLIELLQEKRQTLITQAVTKGLDPNASMKDSGIEWLGTIPAHWTLVPLRRRLLQIEQGWSPACESRPADEGEWGVLKVGCVNYGMFNYLENKALPSDLTPLPVLEVGRGDVLISRANTRELVGSAALVSEVPSRLMLCDKLFRVGYRPDAVDAAYLVLALQSSITRRQFERDATGASGSMQNIGQDSIRNVVLPWPPLQEQRVLAARLDEAFKRVSRVTAGVGEQITRLREYRQALISAAVTGKIDVSSEEAA